MDPRELNAAITAMTNVLYTVLSKEDFFCLSVMLTELGKSMIAMEVLRNICEKQENKLPKMKETHNTEIFPVT